METDLQPNAHQRALELVYAGRTTKKNGFCEVPTTVFVDKIDVDMPELPSVGFYRFQGEKAEQIRAPDQPYSPLALSLHASVWIREDEMGAVRAFAEHLILGGNPSGASPKTAGTPQPTLPTEKRMETLRKAAMLVVEDLFESPTPENIQKSTKMVGSFVYVIMKDPKAYSLLAKLSSHDPYTLQHSVGTSVHCIILGKKIGITNEQELTELGMAGLLHDIGKTKVKKEIINKNGPLDELEWEEMRTHSTQGYEIIKGVAELSDRTKRAVLEHHEDKTGTGYPAGKKLPEVDIFSRIVCLCDVFNALTTDRTYSKARTPYDAFQFMREKLFHKIDDELFKSLVLIYGGKLS
jgi:HD-GYP domain-containing protein (c-di-GMP phosphodiesterase class II)